MRSSVTQGLFLDIIALGEMYLPSYYYQRSTLEMLVIILLFKSIFRSQVSLFPSGLKASLNTLVYKVYLVNHLGLALLWVVALTYEIQTAFTSSFVFSLFRAWNQPSPACSYLHPFNLIICFKNTFHNQFLLLLVRLQNFWIRKEIAHSVMLCSIM